MSLDDVIRIFLIHVHVRPYIVAGIFGNSKKEAKDVRRRINELLETFCDVPLLKLKIWHSNQYSIGFDNGGQIIYGHKETGMRGRAFSHLALVRNIDDETLISAKCSLSGINRPILFYDTDA